MKAPSRTASSVWQPRSACRRAMSRVRRAGDRCPVLDDDPQPDGSPRRLGRPVDHALDRPAGPDDPPRDRAGAVVRVLDLARAGQRERVLASVGRIDRHRDGRQVDDRLHGLVPGHQLLAVEDDPRRRPEAADRVDVRDLHGACLQLERAHADLDPGRHRPAIRARGQLDRQLGLLRPGLRPVTERERTRHHDAELEPHAVLRRARAVRVEQVSLVEHRVGDPLDGLERHAGCTSRAGAASAAAPSSGSAAPCPASSSSRSTASSQEVTACRPL